MKEFTLRKWKLEDAESVAEAANNPVVAANLRNVFPNPYTLDDAKWYVNDCVEKGDEKIVAAMEKRLNKETNPYIAIPIYKYLVSLNDKSINDYLIKTYNKNKNKYGY